MHVCCTSHGRHGGSMFIGRLVRTGASCCGRGLFFLAAAVTSTAFSIGASLLRAHSLWIFISTTHVQFIVEYENDIDYGGTCFSSIGPAVGTRCTTAICATVGAAELLRDAAGGAGERAGRRTRAAVQDHDHGKQVLRRGEVRCGAVRWRCDQTLRRWCIVHDVHAWCLVVQEVV